MFQTFLNLFMNVAPENEDSVTRGNHCYFQLPFLTQLKNTQTFKQVSESLGTREKFAILQLLPGCSLSRSY